jgi:hypothetical protein
MKTTYILAIVLSGLTLLVLGQTLAERAKASLVPVHLSCVRVASGGFNEIAYQGVDGSVGRDIARTLSYECSLRWSGFHKANATLQVFFIARPAVGGYDFVIEEQQHPVFLVRGSNVVVCATSSLIEQRKDRLPEFNIRDYEGAKLRGVVVRLIMGGKPVRVYASQSQWQQAGWAVKFEEALANR